jgi:hypothetical protein
LATANALIISPGREVYTAGATGVARVRDDLRARAIDAVHVRDTRTALAYDATPAGGYDQRPARDVWTYTVRAEPRDAAPFLAQQLAQAAAAPVDNESEAPPSVRIAARNAYLAARDSTVEFLSPTPLFDLRV